MDIVANDTGDQSPLTSHQLEEMAGPDGTPVPLVLPGADVLPQRPYGWAQKLGGVDIASESVAVRADLRTLSMAASRIVDTIICRLAARAVVGEQLEILQRCPNPVPVPLSARSKVPNLPLASPSASTSSDPVLAELTSWTEISAAERVKMLDFLFPVSAFVKARLRAATTPHSTAVSPAVATSLESEGVFASDKGSLTLNVAEATDTTDAGEGVSYWQQQHADGARLFVAKLKVVGCTYFVCWLGAASHQMAVTVAAYLALPAQFPQVRPRLALRFKDDSQPRATTDGIVQALMVCSDVQLARLHSPPFVCAGTRSKYHDRAQ